MTANVPKRTLNTLINALSSGVVPRRGLEYIAVGRKKEVETFVSDLADTAEGGGAFRFIVGRYGNGKSFLTQMVRNYAMDQGFVVMDADLDIGRRLTGSKKEGQNTYRELVRNTAVRTTPDGGAMESIIRSWIASTKASISERTGIPAASVPSLEVENTLREATSDMAVMTHYQDFINVVCMYIREYTEGTTDSRALRWLKGETELKTEARKEVGVNLVIDDANWYDMIKLWSRLYVSMGYKGMVVFLDEAVVLYKLQSSTSRTNNYQRLLSLFNDIMQGKSSYLSMYVCGTPDFIEDPVRGLYSYGALKSRLIAGRYENGYDNYLGPVINLHPLTNEEIYVLLKTLRDLHAQKYAYQSNITDSNLEDYLENILNSDMSSKLLTPREIARDLISLLDTLRQNPDAEFSKMISDRSVDADEDPDSGIIEDLEI